MNLLNKTILDRAAKVGTQENTPSMEQEVLVKFFNPCGVGTWIITSIEQEGNDYLMYGACELGYGYEWGYVSLNELKSVRLPFGLTIERDLYIKPRSKVKDLLKEEDFM